MRPSMIWMLTALALALTGLALQYPDIYTGRRGPSRLTELGRELGYLPNSWWEPIVWPLVVMAALIILFLAWALWPQKKVPKRWRPPMEGD